MALLRAALVAIALCQATAVPHASTIQFPGKPVVRKYNTSSGRSESLLNVHLVAHTHDDVGWLKTVDELFEGINNNIQRAQVRNIISSVVASLAANSDRKFIYVEQAFFQMWWAEQSPQTQATTRQLVASGQLEFINGGWCMHDETDNTYAEQVDQTTLGHRYLLNQFNVTPKATWQIDPWGHTAFQATYMSSPLAGFSSVFYGRIDWEEAQQRNAAQTAETVWAPSRSLGLNAATLGGHLYNCYQPPPGFDMNVYSNDDPIADDPTSPSYNVPAKVDAFVAYAQQQAAAYRGNDIILTMGSDFNYENADTWFQNLDRIIHYVNLDGRVNVLYSSPSIYAEAKLASVPSWPINTADYVPYSEYPHAYHTGSFTSRAALKGYVRESSSVWAALRLLQFYAARPADVLAPTNPLYRLERALGVAQHHDGVAGSSKQAVAFDYARRIAQGRAVGAELLLAPVLAKLTGYTPAGGPNSSAWVVCDLANATICPSLEAAGTAATALLLFNSQGQAVAASPVLLPMPVAAGGSYAVYDADAKPVTAQLLPLSAADLYLRDQYYSYAAGPAVQWLAFTAALPPGGYAVYFVAPAASAVDAPHTHASVVTRVLGGSGGGAGDAAINNSRLTLTFSAATGLLTAYADAVTGVDTAVTQELRYYPASNGDWAKNLPAAGAYFMRPSANSTLPVAVGPRVALTFVTGPVVSEARQVFGPWASQVVRLWAGAADAQLQFDIGPIDVSDGVGKEVVSVFSAPAIASRATFFTDSNGRDTLTRVRDARPSFNYTVLEPIAGNFYPVNIAYLTDPADPDTSLTLAVVTDRAQGGSSIADGTLELLVQRRLLQDDRQGVGEPLNETGLTGAGLAVRGMHRFSLAPGAASAALRRGALADAMFRPLPAYAPLAPGVTPAQWVAAYSPTFSGLAAPLPPQLHLLTAHALGPAALLLRLAHSYEAGEDAALSQPATIDLATLFTGVTVSGCVESTVTGNQPLAAAPRTTYKLDNGTSVTLPILPPAPAGPGLTVTLGPMQIRTFTCTASA